MGTVPILQHRGVLIASIQSALSDAEWLALQGELARQVGDRRARGVVIDVTLMDVMDSFATRTLRTIGQTVLLRGATPVVVGIQPEVALAMVQLGLAQRLEGLPTALDLEQGLDLLETVA